MNRTKLAEQLYMLKSQLEELYQAALRATSPGLADEITACLVRIQELEQLLAQE